MIAKTDSPRIFHLSGDYPDSFEAFKTPVIKTLLELTDNAFDHRVLSINRRPVNAFRLAAALLRGLGKPTLHIRSERFAAGWAIEYDAPGRGVFHATMLHQLGDWIASEIQAEGGCDLIVGHKLTIEGVAARRAAKVLGVPYALSIQGDTDTKIISARPDLIPEFRKIYRDAAIVFPFAPWAQAMVEKRLGLYRPDAVLLPCPTDLDLAEEPRSGGGGLISVFHLKNRKRKNLAGMVAALRILQAHDPNTVKLGVIGGGSDTDNAACLAMTSGIPNLTLEGPMDRVRLRQRMMAATGFVMPSMRESFGLVFIEALFCGLPIVYPAGTAVDGFFDGKNFAIKVNARNPQSIAAGMRRLVYNEDELKRELAEWLRGEGALQFTRPVIAQKFASGLRHALKQV